MIPWSNDVEAFHTSIRGSKELEQVWKKIQAKLRRCRWQVEWKVLMLVLFQHWFMIQLIRFAWGRTRCHLILSFAEGTAFKNGLSQSGVKHGTSNRKKTFVLIQQRYSIEPPYPEKRSTTCHLSQKDSSKPERFTFVATCQGAAPSRGPVMHHFVVLGFDKTSSI